MVNFLLKLARSVVKHVLGVITSQINLIGDAVTSPLRAMVQQVLGGIWKGEGANRFVEEMTNEVIPQLIGVGNMTNNFGSLINKGLDMMDRADRAATNRANQLVDVFHKIINL